MALINRPIAPSYMATTSYPPSLQANTDTQQTYLHWTDVGQPAHASPSTRGNHRHPIAMARVANESYHTPRQGLREPGGHRHQGGIPRVGYDYSHTSQEVT